MSQKPRTTRKSLKNINYLKLKGEEKYVKKVPSTRIDFTSPEGFKSIKTGRKKLINKPTSHYSSKELTKVQRNIQIYVGNRKIGKTFRRSDLDKVKLESFDIKMYKVKTVFSNGKHADIVQLLENPETQHVIIKKQYPMIHKDIFYNEVLILYKLRECEFVPKLLKINLDKRTIYMTYCGEPISANKIENYKQTLDFYQKELLEKWRIYHNDIKYGNVCQRGNKIYLIDFGWSSHKKIIPGYTF